MDWLLNGERGRTLDPADRGLAYGDGLFETLAIRRGVPRLFERHLARLQEGCRRLALAAPPPARLRAELAEVTAGAAHGTAKLLITRGGGPRGYRARGGAPTRLVGFAAEPPAVRRTAGV